MKNDYNIVFEIKVLDNMINRKVVTKIKQCNIPFLLSPVQVKILHFLLQHKTTDIYQKDIENLIESRRSTTSGILNTMEKNKLIKRIHNKNDARSKQILLTESSIQLEKQMRKHKKIVESALKENITKEELEIFFKVTEKIKNNIMNM